MDKGVQQKQINNAICLMSKMIRGRISFHEKMLKKTDQQKLKKKKKKKKKFKINKHTSDPKCLNSFRK